MGKCCLCVANTEKLLIDETTHFIAIVPFAATFPFEIWIIARDHSSHFHKLDCEKAVDLGALLKLMLRKMSLQLNNPPFNFMIQTAPLQVKESQLRYSHWFLQIVPQLSGVGGFEIGTGCYINPVFPEDAAKVTREVNLAAGVGCRHQICLYLIELEKITCYFTRNTKPFFGNVCVTKGEEAYTIK